MEQEKNTTVRIRLSEDEVRMAILEFAAKANPEVAARLQLLRKQEEELKQADSKKGARMRKAGGLPTGSVTSVYGIRPVSITNLVEIDISSDDYSSGSLNHATVVIETYYESSTLNPGTNGENDVK